MRRLSRDHRWTSLHPSQRRTAHRRMRDLSLLVETFCQSRPSLCRFILIAAPTAAPAVAISSVASWHEAEVSPTSAIWPRAAISRGFRPVDPEIGDGIVWRFVPAGNIETGCKPAGVPDGWLHQTASAPPSMLAEPPNN